MIKKRMTNILAILAAANIAAVVAFAAPKEDQSTDKLNKKLKTVNEKGEFDETRATLTEVLVTKNEALAMQQLNKLIGKYRGSPLEPGLLFRKAELFVRQSKSARFFEFNRADDKMLTLIPKTMKNATSKNKIEQAVSIYEEIQRRYPNYSELDIVLFNNAFLRQQLNQDDKAEKIFRMIIKQFPESILMPDTYLALAEMLYQKRRYEEALKDYEAIKNYPLARVYPYAIYKTGWTKYQLKDVVGAIKELELAIDVSEKLAEQDNSKINLKNEALNDLVLFYPEAYEAKKAFVYFKRLAKDQAGLYIIDLARLYERHSRFQDLEIVLNDLISDMPTSQDTSVAYRMIIENDLTARNYDKATGHLASFESHCLKYFKHEYAVMGKAFAKGQPKDLLKTAKPDEDGEDEFSKSCPVILAKQSLKLSVKWHKEWQNKSKQAKEASVAKSDHKKIEHIADATELAYSIYLRNSAEIDKKELVRFSYSELLFQRKKFRLASTEYFKVAQKIKDPKVLHESSYYAIVSLEQAVADKWSDADEDKYTELAQHYINKNPQGKYVTEIRFKKAFIAYEKSRYNEALPEFKKIGWSQGDPKLTLKSQDLYLDILNIQKKYKELIESTDHLMSQKVTSERKDALQKIYRASYFSLATRKEKDGELEEAVRLYDQFAHQNSNSELADKAMWNQTQILVKQNKMKTAADKSYELFEMFPKSEFVKKSLQKASELYEYLAETENAAKTLKNLAKYDSKDSLKWQKLSADFYMLSGDYKSGMDIYREVLKNPDPKVRAQIVATLNGLDKANLFSNKESRDMVRKYGTTEYSDAEIISTQRLYAENNYEKAFKMASQIVGDKNAPDDVQAQARFIQAEILRKEFESQSVKTSIERLQIVLTIKTEKLDKAQRAFESTIKYGNPKVTLRAFYSLAKMYQHYVEALKAVQIKDEISEKDKKVLMSEIENIVMPIEEKIADTLQQGIDFSKKYPSYDGYAFELRNELNKVNFKGYKFVKYEVTEPVVALPSVN